MLQRARRNKSASDRMGVLTPVTAKDAQFPLINRVLGPPPAPASGPLNRIPQSNILVKQSREMSQASHPGGTFLYTSYTFENDLTDQRFTSSQTFRANDKKYTTRDGGMVLTFVLFGAYCVRLQPIANVWAMVRICGSAKCDKSVKLCLPPRVAPQ